MTGPPSARFYRMEKTGVLRPQVYFSATKVIRNKHVTDFQEQSFLVVKPEGWTKVGF